MMLQTRKSDFILYIMKEVESHETHNHLKLMKNSEFKKKHKNMEGKIKTMHQFGLLTEYISLI